MAHDYVRRFPSKDARQNQTRQTLYEGAVEQLERHMRSLDARIAQLTEERHAVYTQLHDARTTLAGLHREAHVLAAKEADNE